MSGGHTDESFRKMHLGDFEPDISFEQLLKRVKQEPCSKIAEELHFAHKRNDLHKAKIKELEKTLREFEQAIYNEKELLDMQVNQAIRDLEQQASGIEAAVRINLKSYSDPYVVKLMDRAVELRSQAEALKEQGE